MEIDELRLEYQNGGKNKSMDALRKMSMVNGHPVLKRMRLQLVLETILWSLFLSVYYTGFDGDQKPLLWNVALVASVMLLVLHNLLGYRLVQSPINGPNLSESLGRYVYRIKRYAIISIAARVIAIMAILAFFASSVDWNWTKIFVWSIFVSALISVQIFFLWKIWKGRIGKIENQIGSLEVENGTD